MLKSNTGANVFNRQILNTNWLKMIAIVAMTIDHLTWTFLSGYRTDILTLFLHGIGRLTAQSLASLLEVARKGYLGECDDRWSNLEPKVEALVSFISRSIKNLLVT